MTSVEKIIYNTSAIVQNIRVLLKNYKTRNISYLTSIFKKISEKSYEEIDIEIEKLMKIFKNDINPDTIEVSRLINKLMMLSRRDDIIEVASSINVFIQNTGVRKGDLYRKIKEIIENLPNSYDQEKIENAKKELILADIDIEILYDENYGKNYKNNYLNILKMLKEYPESINFLIKRNYDDCQTMKELIDQDDSGFLTVNDILDFEKCVLFVKSLGTEQSIIATNDNDFINNFTKAIQESKESLGVYFQSYSHNFPELKDLFTNNLDPSGASRQIIKYISEKSQITISSDKYYQGKNIIERYESINAFVSLESDKEKKKQYLLSISSYISLTELHDIEKGTYQQWLTTDFLNVKDEQKYIFSLRFSFLEWKNSNFYFLVDIPA